MSTPRPFGVHYLPPAFNEGIQSLIAHLSTEAGMEQCCFPCMIPHFLCSNAVQTTVTYLLFPLSDGEVGAEDGKEEVSLEASVQITCNACYLKGTATGDFSVEGDFNVTAFVDNLESEIKNFTTGLESYVAEYIKGNDTAVTELDFDVPAPHLPEYHLHFQFDGLELYMLLDTVLSGKATYTLNLYTSETVYGIAVGDEQVGVVFAVDLVLSAESQLDISSGFHLRLEDGVGIDVSLFAEDVSSITL